GGDGGDGGDGGAGGYGGGGAGGSLVLLASAFDVSTTGELRALGGLGGDEFAPAGRVAIADNIAGHRTPATVVAPAATIVGSGVSVVAENLYGDRETPLIPDLVDGAELYGPADLTPADFPQVVAGAPAGADLALVRLAAGPPPVDDDF